MTLCVPQNTRFGAGSGGRAGFCCAEHCRHPEKGTRAWAQEEVSSEDGHQGVTQCILPHLLASICPTGSVLPLEQGADLTPTILLLSPLGCKALFSVTASIP